MTVAEQLLNRVVLPDWRGPLTRRAGNRKTAFMSTVSSDLFIYRRFIACFSSGNHPFKI